MAVIWLDRVNERAYAVSPLCKPKICNFRHQISDVFFLDIAEVIVTKVYCTILDKLPRHRVCRLGPYKPFDDRWMLKFHENIIQFEIYTRHISTTV